MNTDLKRSTKPAGKTHGLGVPCNHVLRSWVPAFAGTTAKLALMPAPCG